MDDYPNAVTTYQLIRLRELAYGPTLDAADREALLALLNTRTLLMEGVDALRRDRAVIGDLLRKTIRDMRL